MKRAQNYFLLIALSLVSQASLCEMPRDELEHYRYHDLTLVGTFRSASGWRACFQLPDKSLRIADQGSYVGPNSGRITEIGNNRLVVTELIDVNQGELLENSFAWPMKVRTIDIKSTGCTAARLAHKGKNK